MFRKTLPAWSALAFALVAAGCSGSGETPVSPTLSTPAGLDANEDGSTLKVNAPLGLSPSGGVEVSDREVTLRFQPSQGRHVQLHGMQHRVELYNQHQQRIAEWTTPGTSVTTPQLEYRESYSWRVQAVLDGHTGPWSETAAFSVPAPPTPPECLAQPIEVNRLPCILAVAAKSEEWPNCQAGSGKACHRFTREVARALSLGDPLWGLLAKPPGTWQCSMIDCGSHVPGGFGEDVIAYCTNPVSCRNPAGPDGRTDWVVIDIVTGAGLPGAHIGWNPVPRVFNRGSNYWAPVP